MKSINNLAVFFLLLEICSCTVLKDSPKYKLQDGFYRSKIGASKKANLYVINNDTSINIYLISKKNNRLLGLDSLPKTILTLPQQSSGTYPAAYVFNKTSFDVDIVTFPFKYRPARLNLPRQFNTLLNGAVYIGVRNDIFTLNYEKRPVKKFERQTDHYGFSYGFFTGIGGTLMNSSTTNGYINYEYDGVVWARGIAGIIAVNNFTVGLALGIDNLLDHNHNFWNYQQKPWVGLALGLNLN